MKIDVAILPKEIGQSDLSDTVCIVLDIFRASTSMVTAMSNGCKRIIPVVSIEEAYRIREQTGQALFAGERKSIKIEGFDFGNSPFDFSRDRVSDQTIIMTTTNGTIAVNATEKAFRSFIGAFINAEAVCRRALRYQKNVLVVCAGTDEEFSLEDSLCAGYLVKILNADKTLELTDAAQGALLMYTAAEKDLFAAAKTSRNGQRLVELDKVNEIEYCVRQNIVDIVPEYRDKQLCVNKLN